MEDTKKEPSKGYIPSEIEDKWYNFWLKNNLFSPESDSGRPSFSIVIPPPNVTGTLHMGHALNATLQDTLCRWKRMKGFKVLWVPGTDHAGIATQNVVEKMLAKENLTRHTLGRDEFIKRVWEWKRSYGGQIIHQLKKIGASCDWTKERFTLDEGLSNAVREVFVSLFNEGLIYRALRLINWCPRCYTALSDLEAEHEELEGRLTYIKYPLEDGSGHIVVATTRPETMLGDTAVAVNPLDVRYQQLAGKRLILPLTDRAIPIVTDTEVDQAFGTGAVKVTPSHDFNDEAIAKRQNPNLPFITVIGLDGTMTADAGRRFAGLDRYECRKQVVADLKEKGLIQKEEKHVHSVASCYRCKTIIEPLPTAQWYVSVSSMAKDAIDAVKEGKIRIIPDGWKNNYYSWMENIRDWCISRQIWWGHRIPVWYCPKCTDDQGASNSESIFIVLSKKLRGLNEGTYKQLTEAGVEHKDIIQNVRSLTVGISVKPFSASVDPTSCPHCGCGDIIRDQDVLDTWFSSALWPFSTMGWPDKTKDLSEYYPTSVLVTAFDILFFWVARMIMMGLKFMKDRPFNDVYIHALIRDESGQKMSKSKGNVIDPLIMIDEYGADSFRFSLAAFAAQGRDIRFSEERVEGYKHFINKLWNASRFINLNIEKYGFDKGLKIEEIAKELLVTDRALMRLPERWILNRLSFAAAEVNRGLEEYRFNDAANAVYQFVWYEFCDWYIELSKTSFERSKEYSEAALKCLLYVLDASVRLLHPFMPFVTEEIWNSYPHEGKTIMLTSYPDMLAEDAEALERMDFVINAVTGIRSIRGEFNISPSKKISALIRTFSDAARLNLLEHKDYISALTRCGENLEIGENVEKSKGSVTSVKTEMEIYVPLSGLFDIEAETERLDKELKKVDEAIHGLNIKLSNEDFIERAPKAVVDKEKLKYNEHILKRERIVENISKLKEIK
ncbi:MAG: valine--tRNA ligase [Nitrospirae bacterium]|nr:valine--tRNA ligase [Nitrospirota bacterium]MBF0534480.1 valine--tRNA ligase [Nitrospirota bacterium]MBF0617106.1 valine--tRNA ligase [Nitrospirota bacterium]